MEIDQEPRPEPAEEATCDDPEVCRLSLDPVIVLGKSINGINIEMRAQPGSMPCLVQGVYGIAQTSLSLWLFQMAAAVHAGIEIQQEPRPEPAEEATRDRSQVRLLI
jgi:hypothetical protein